MIVEPFRPADRQFVMHEDLDGIMRGNAPSFANGITGEQIMVALVHLRAGSATEAHSHPNEQWSIILKGSYTAVIDGVTCEARPGSILYMPANVIHSGRANDDVTFYTVKDTSYGRHGTMVGSNVTEPFAAPLV